VSLTRPVRPELVEGLHFLFCAQKEERCFDKLSTNGIGFDDPRERRDGLKP
jgi:hypothetical protein